MTEEEMKAAIAKLTESVSKLEAKNSELIDREKKAKADAEAAREAAEEAAANAERESKDVAAIEKRLADKHTKEMAKLQSQLDERNQRLSTLLIDNALTTNLTKAGITDPDHLEMLSGHFKTKAVLDGDRALIDGLDIEQFVSDFAASDRGKKYIPAPANSGGNALGNRAQVTTVPDQWNLTRYMEMKRDNPDLAKTYAEKHNQKF